MFFAMRQRSVGAGERKMDEAFLVILARRPGETRDRDRQLRLRPVERARGHRLGDRAAYRPAIRHQIVGQAEQVAFRLVRIGHEAAIEDTAAARDIGEQRGEQPAGAAFRGRQLPLRILRRAQNALREIADAVGKGSFEFFGHTVSVNVPEKPGVPVARTA